MKCADVTELPSWTPDEVDLFKQGKPFIVLVKTAVDHTYVPLSGRLHDSWSE